MVRYPCEDEKIFKVAPKISIVLSIWIIVETNIGGLGNTIIFLTALVYLIVMVGLCAIVIQIKMP